MRTAFFLAAAAAIVPPALASAQADTTIPGVTFRVYRVSGELDALAELASNQTPNLDELRPALDFGPGDFGGLGAPIVAAVTGELVVETAGRYVFRLISDDGSRLAIGDRFTLDNDGVHAMRTIESDPVALEPGRYPLAIDYFDAGDGRGLRLEWRRPGASAFEIVGPDHLRTEDDPTRVTAPGVKRLAAPARAGDGVPLEDVHPGWRVRRIRPPGFEPKVGAMAFLPDGRLVIGTFDPLQRDDRELPDIDSKPPDELLALGNLDAQDPAEITVERIATDVYEPSGLLVHDGDLYVAHRKAVARLEDRDDDGFYETHVPVGEGWEGWNYHQFAFGLVERDGLLYTALSTAMAPPKWEGMGTNAAPNGPMRGGVVEIDPESRHARVIAGGTRTPNGLGITPAGDMIYLDNQGTWFPTSTLAEVIPGRFYGHYNRTNPVPNLADRFPLGGHPSVFADRPRTPATILMPHNDVVNSPTQPLPINDGPFAGQVLVGELTAGGVRRVFLERVNGTLQGALFRFTQGLEAGVNRMAWGPDGSLYLGCIGAQGNWNWLGTQFGLQRLVPTGRAAFEMLAVRATPDGFRVEFTEPVDPSWLARPANFAVESWAYEPTAEYGGPPVRPRAHAVASAEPDPDGRAVTLRLDGLEPGRCYRLRTDPVSAAGERIWSTEAWYTLNVLPLREAPQPASLAGRAITPEHLGVGAMPPADAVTLMGRNSSAVMRTGGGSRFAPLEDDAVEGGPDHVAVGKGTGDLVSTTVFADARLHVEWLAPPGGLGQFRGNSGVYLQDRYEIQVLGTPPGDRDLADNEAAAVYGVKPADRNASAGPGAWQAYDVWFRAPRFGDDGAKTEDARVTVYWNGVLVHDDVAIPHPTGGRHDDGETPNADTGLQVGPLRLQDHASAADGPVRYRNVWIAPLDPVSSQPGPWTRPLRDRPRDAWMVRGGEADYRLEDGRLTGTTRPDTPNTFFTTRDTHADFELIYEARVHPELNSGVQIRSEVVGGADNRRGGLRGYQVELDPSARSYSGGIYDEQGRGWLHPLHAAPYARRALRHDGWNEIRVVAAGPVIRTWVNGVPAAEVFDAARDRGHIGFQVHDVGGRTEPLSVAFRNVRLRELRPAGP